MSDFINQILAAFDLQQLQHFHFMRPWWLALIIPFYLIYRSYIRSDDALVHWRKKMSKDILKHLTVSGTQRRWFTPKKLSVVMMILATLILSGPSWQQQPSPFLVDESVLVIALDVSSTMNQNDVEPSRLLRAKQKVNALLEIRGDAKTALIAFAGSAHIAMPVTDDREMIRHFLDILESSLVPGKGQKPQNVLGKADKLFARTKTPGTLLLLTDGAPDEAIAEYEAFFEQQPHHLVVWSIGDPKASFTGEQSDFIATDIAKLKTLASGAGGEMVKFSLDDHDIHQVSKAIENNLVTVTDKNQPWYDSGYPLLFIVAALQIIWFRRGWSIQW